MTTTPAVDPKRTADQWGVLGAPRFVPMPPPRANGSGERVGGLRKLAKELRANPGKWAAVMQSESRHAVSNGAAAFQRGTVGPAAHWETTARTDPETKIVALYVRYVGPAGR